MAGSIAVREVGKAIGGMVVIVNKMHGRDALSAINALLLQPRPGKPDQTLTRP